MSDKKDGIDAGDLDALDALLLEGEETTEEESSDEELAQEALEATNEDTDAEEAEEAEESEESEEAAEESEEESEEEQAEEEAEVDPKDAVIGDFRRKNRDLELENARLVGENTARKSMQSPAKEAEVVKSPMELEEEAYIEEYGSLPPEGVPMTSKLYKEQRAFDAEQANSAVQAPTGLDATTEIAINQLQNTELSVEKMGEGRDITSVLTAANEVLTEGDVLDLQNHVKKHGQVSGLKQAYKVGVRRLEEAGKLPAAKKPVKPVKKVTPKKVNKKPKSIDELLTQEDDGYVEESGSQTKRLASVIANSCCR